MLVDYDESEGKITNFRCFLADWGTANTNGEGRFFGGTPVYAGPRSFEHQFKDLFSFGRLALELYSNQPGLSHKIMN